MKIQELLNQSNPYWKYAAVDKSGLGALFSARPKIKDDIWIVEDGDFKDVGFFELDGDWKDSLIVRGEE